MTAAAYKWITSFTSLGVARPVHAPTVDSWFLAPDAFNVVVALILVYIRGAAILWSMLFHCSFHLKLHTGHGN